MTKYVDQYNALLCEFEAAKVGAARLPLCRQMHTVRHALHSTRAASAVLLTCCLAGGVLVQCSTRVHAPCPCAPDQCPNHTPAQAAVLPDAPGALDFNCSRWSALNRDMRKYRGTGFDANLGSRSTSNLVYRLLRRISGAVAYSGEASAALPQWLSRARAYHLNLAQPRPPLLPQ